MKNETTNAAVKKTTQETVVKKTVAKKAATKKSPAKKAATTTKAKVSVSPETRITAKIDIGFGNILYLRGDGPGLSWEHGVPMDCDKNSVWSWTTTATAKAFTYKVLVNDVSWSMGEDFTAHVGKNNKADPKF
jgi:hypothetical protein